MKPTLAFLTLLFVTAQAHAGVISSTGMTAIAPPDSVQEGYLEDNSTIYYFTECADTIVTDSFDVDISEPGTYTSFAVNPKAYSVGTPVNSYYIHFDPVAHTLVLGRTGSITFDETILGIVLISGWSTGINSFVDSDPIFGHPGTYYDSADTVHGIELSPYSYRDAITLSADRHTVIISRFGTDFATDDMRIITSSTMTATPENAPQSPQIHSLNASPNPYQPAHVDSLRTGRCCPRHPEDLRSKGPGSGHACRRVPDAGRASGSLERSERLQ